MAVLDRKPIYDRALECNGLFDKLVTYENDPAGPCQHHREAFEYWTRRHLVFARKSPCLDSRLRNDSFARDHVVHLLKVLSGCITKCRF